MNDSEDYQLLQGIKDALSNFVCDGLESLKSEVNRFALRNISLSSSEEIDKLIKNDSTSLLTDYQVALNHVAAQIRECVSKEKEILEEIRLKQEEAKKAENKKIRMEKSFAVLKAKTESSKIKAENRQSQLQRVNSLNRAALGLECRITKRNTVLLAFVDLDGGDLKSGKYVDENSQPFHVELCLPVDKDGLYKVLECVPHVPQLDRMVQTLNEKRDLSGFMVTLRGQFMAL